MKLILLATALGAMLAGTAAPAFAQVDNPVGCRRTEDGPSVMEATSYGETLCGRSAPFSGRRPQCDDRNRDPAKRTRLLCGMPILEGFATAGQTRWTTGRIHGPETGGTCRGTLPTLADDTPRIVDVSGSGTAGERWRRPRSTSCGGAR